MKQIRYQQISSTNTICTQLNSLDWSVYNLGNDKEETSAKVKPTMKHILDQFICGNSKP